ncbi:MAG: hypothetical protein IKZ92_05250 [Muribaculaceae bacterium]|nr:hypothetical protein [Muribaculaceae bacterium]
MDNAIVISPRVVDRLRFMDAEERRLIFDALISDEVLCEPRAVSLTVAQELNYILIRDMVLRESHRFNAFNAIQTGANDSLKNSHAMVS